MSTDFQQARLALGARLRELRAGITGRDLAERLGWTQSKVSKLETGRQTASAADPVAWAEATGHPDVAGELVSRLRGLESGTRSWRRQLAAGHRPAQETLTVVPALAHEAVRARVRRQEELYDPSPRFEIVLREAALHAMV